MLLDAFGELVYIENNLDITPFQRVESIFRLQLDLLFNQPYVHNYEAFEPRGKCYTSVNRPTALRTLEGYNELLQCLYPYFVSARDVLLQNVNPSRFTIVLNVRRAWANYMFEGSTTVSHMHRGNVSLVGIFYLDAPVGSSKLVFIDDDVNGKLDTEYTLDRKIYIEPHPYSFVVHKGTAMHAVSEHLSKEKRIAVIIEMTAVYINKEESYDY